MPLQDDDIFVVGYGGWTSIACMPSGTPLHNASSVGALPFKGRLVQVTAASVQRQMNVPQVQSYYTPYLKSDTVRSPIRVGYGTYVFTGELSFELTECMADEMLRDDFFERSSWFSLQFFDGQNTCCVTNCFWSSVGITCNPNATVTASISFSSNNGYQSNLQVTRGNLDESYTYDDNDFLVPYWQCGHDGFKEFSINISRDVTPIFLNGPLLTASYLKPGIPSISANATTVEFIDFGHFNNLRIYIGRRHHVTMHDAFLQSKAYHMSSMGDTGEKSYVWNAMRDDARKRIFSIG